MKKTLLSLFALFITTMAFAYDAKIDGIYYNLNSGNNTAEVTYTVYGYKGNVVITIRPIPTCPTILNLPCKPSLFFLNTLM